MARRKPIVVSVVGARPQFIKLAPLSRYLKSSCRHIIIHSGQHYDYEMSRVFFDQLHITEPDINLNVGSGDHGYQTARILEKCEKSLISVQPHLVLVYGDTNTTLAGALAAAKRGFPVGHIEAGLRSFRRAMPEEINRIMTDHISNLLFYPTAAARKNLMREGITRGLVNSGDLMFEILESCRPLIARRKSILKKRGLVEGRYLLVTLHRAENVDDASRLERFVAIMEEMDRTVLFLAHPRTIKNLRRFGLAGRLRKMPGFIIERPQPYLETLALISGAAAVMTDSGGLQKESCFLGRPCLTMRPETEWVETIKSGANRLVDLSPAGIRKALKEMRPRRRKPTSKIKGRKPSEIIGAAIMDFLHDK